MGRMEETLKISSRKVRGSTSRISLIAGRKDIDIKSRNTPEIRKSHCKLDIIDMEKPWIDIETGIYRVNQPPIAAPENIPIAFNILNIATDLARFGWGIASNIKFPILKLNPAQENPASICIKRI